MRLIIALPLLLIAGCSSSDPVADNNVDINAAAQQAQGSIDAYGANSAETPEPAVPPKQASGRPIRSRR